MEARGRQATPARLSQFSHNNGRHFLGLFHGLDTVQSVSPRLSLSLSLSLSLFLDPLWEPSHKQHDLPQLRTGPPRHMAVKLCCLKSHT